MEKWCFKTPEGRWCGFGPYYAMFPIEFARSAIESFCPKGGHVLDPFCGRGTVPFVAKFSDRDSVGIDLNQVAWVYSKAKTEPCPDKQRLYRRIEEIAQAVTGDDQEPENEFQEWAWSTEVLGFLHAARRELHWRQSSTDRTLMAFLLVHLHAKLGNGLSNQMRQSKSLSPDYAVRWWKQRDLRPPKINPVSYICERIAWRYARGLPKSAYKAHIYLGDARRVLRQQAKQMHFDMILTSPPYFGITNYQYDNWIRLWLLSGPALPDWTTRQRYEHRERYRDMLMTVFQEAAERSRSDVVAYVRTDARPYTFHITLKAIRRAWPGNKIFLRQDKYKKETQTALFGDKAEKPGEIDILSLPLKHRAPINFKFLKD